MSNESESVLKATPSSSKPSSSLITVLDDANNFEAKEANSCDNTLEGRASKRNFLEVNNTEKYKQFLIKPFETKRLKQSDTLDKVRQFLPMLKESTNKLLDDFKANPEKLDIENVEDEDDQHIEMNLALVPDSGSDEESDNDDESDDDHDSTNKNKLNKYMSLLNGNNESDDDDDEEEEDESSEPNPLDELKLGFKVDNPNEIKKLKTSLNQSENKSKRNLIKVIETCEESGDGEKPKTSDSA